MKLRILQKTGMPVNLRGLESAIFWLPYRGARTLELNKWTIVGSPLNGTIEVELTDFEKSGLNVGDGQTFKGQLQFPGETMTVKFDRELNVEMNDNEEKQICYDTSHSS